MNQKDTRQNLKSKNEEIANFFEQQKVQKEKLMRENISRQQNKNFLNAMINGIKRQAYKENKIDDIQFYKGDYDKYFADFVRSTLLLQNENDNILSKMKFKANAISDAEAIAMLDNNFLTNIVGNFQSSTKKENNIHNAYILYKNAIAFTERALAKEYGIDNYYDMPNSKNDEAKLAYQNFEEFKENKEEEFQLLANCNADFMAFSRNPKKFIEELAMVNPKKERRAGKYAIVLVAAIGAAVVGMYGVGIITDYLKYQSEMTALANSFGYTNPEEMFAELNNFQYFYLTEEEAQTVFNESFNSNIAYIAQVNGYSNTQEMMQDIEDHSVNTLTTKMDALAKIEHQKDIMQQDLCKEYYCENYDELIRLMRTTSNNSNIDETTRNLGDLSYTNPSMKFLGEKLDYINAYFDSEIEKINNTTYPRQEPIIQGKLYNDIMDQINLESLTFKAEFHHLLEYNDKVFYAYNGQISYTGNEATEIANKYGKVIDQLQNNDDYLFGHTSPITNDYANLGSESQLDALNSLSQESIGNSFVGLDDVASTAVLGAGIATTIRTSGFLNTLRKNQKVRKNQNELNKLQQQIKEDDLQR